MDLAEQQGLLDGKAIAELRRQVAESKFVITPEAIAKVLVDHGHLTPFQARKLVSQALGDEPDPVEQKVAEKPKPKPPPKPVEDLTFADGTPPSGVKPQRSEPEPKPVETLRKPSPAEPATKNPPPKKPSAAPVEMPAQIIVRKPDEKPPSKPPSGLQPPVEGSTADDFVELKSIDPAPHTRGNRWKTDKPSSSLAETVELTPIDLPPLTPLPPTELVPIDDLFGDTPPSASTSAPAPAHRASAASAEMLKPLKPVSPLTPLTPLQPATPLTPLRPVGKAAKNVWDSPLMLIGGGSLGVILVLFAFLFYALTRGSAAELFGQGEDEYRGGNYANAGAIYEKFLKKYPTDPNASLARVRRGMATLRQVTDDGRNARVGLETARQVLPTIEGEEKFAEARSELATILPEIADEFATQASQTEDAARKTDFVKLANEALTLVNNPAYLPASLRKEREGHISRIVDKLKSADRGIQQEKDLAAALEKIGSAAEKGQASVAYQAQSDLLRTYPGLATNPQLVAAVRQVGEKEKQLVTVTTGGPEPFKTDHELGSQRVVIAYQDEGAPAPAATSEPVFLLIEGAVYGLDATSGRVLWRRFVGYEATNMPQPIGEGSTADCLLIDAVRHELVRVKGSSGELLWRQKLSGDAEGPVVAGNRVLLATHTGTVMALDAANGNITATAQLPQRIVVAPAIRQTRVYQLGEHSTLFVLDATTLACSETIYLGHQAGELFVPPVAVLDQLLVVTSPADDYSEIRVLTPDANSKKLVPFGRAQRLKGRIVTPLAVSAARVAATTDLGQVAVYDVDSAGAKEHLNHIAGLEASEPTPRHAFLTLDRNRLWVASHRSTLFEVQTSLSTLARKWTEPHDDAFVAPLKLHGDLLVTARRRGNVPAVLVEGFRSLTGEKPVWTTHVAAPLSALSATEAGASVTSLTAEGRLYSIGNDAFQNSKDLRPTYSPRPKNTSVLGEPYISPDGQKIVWTEAQGGGQIVSYDAAAGGKPATFTPAGHVIAPAIPLFGGVIAPLADGTVALLKPNPADAAATPFLPPLVPDSLPQWTRPVPLADGTIFLISDGRDVTYAVTKRDQPRESLVEASHGKSGGPVVSPLVVAGSTIVGVVRLESTDALAGFDAKAKPLFEPVPLEGRVIAGPFAVGGLAFVSAEPDGLVCLGGDGRVRWQRPPDQGFLAGPPVALPDGDLLVAHQSGLVCRLDAANGKERSRHEVGEPLAGPICVLKSQAYLSGSDGVVHRIPLPPRP